MDVDTNTGRGEKVTEHYLPGAGTNYERKKYRKIIENCMKGYYDLAQLLRRRVQVNLNFEQARKRDKNMMRRWQT